MKITAIPRRETDTYLPLPLYSNQVPAGFPSPADDYIESALDLNEYLVRNPTATFYARAAGDSMTGVGIQDGALLIVDRAVTPRHGHVVIAALNGELTCKILDLKQRVLRAANPEYPSVPVHEELELLIEGVVLHAINPLSIP